MNPENLQLTTPLAVPIAGESVRVPMGDSELVLEATRGGYSLLWHAGREAQRHVLGLPRAAALTLELRPPILPVRLLLRQTLTLAPGARVHGYVQLPLVPVLCWQQERELPGTPLLEFPPPSLQAEWDEELGAIYSASSPWFVRYPVHGGEPRATVPVRVKNLGDAVCSPGHLPLLLAPEQLGELRGGIAATPRRLIWDGIRWSTQVRSATSVEVGA